MYLVVYIVKICLLYELPAIILLIITEKYRVISFLSMKRKNNFRSDCFKQKAWNISNTCKHINNVEISMLDNYEIKRSSQEFYVKNYKINITCCNCSNNNISTRLFLTFSTVVICVTLCSPSSLSLFINNSQC